MSNDSDFPESSGAPSPIPPSLSFKKRARRRLVGAVVFAGLAAIILPMVMDEELKQVENVQIRIPDPDQAPPFRPLQDTGETRAPERLAEPAKPVEEPPKPETPKPTETPKPPPKPTEAPKPADPPKPAPKPAETDAQRAAAILSGKTPPDPAPSADKSSAGKFVILIGAFSNPANVTQLKTKFGEIGVKAYTEPLDAPDGKKTRVRAGPFDNRAAAEKALEKIRRIGVNGEIRSQQ